MKMWSGRFEQPADAAFDAWQRSFPYDRRLLPEEILASRAYAEALAVAGVLSSSELLAILAGLDGILAAGIPGDTDPSIEDVHHFVEQRLVEAAGDAGLKLHTGRSRNEQIATDLRLFARGHAGEIIARLRGLVDAIIDRAEAAGDAAMPSYTHLQRAEPVLVAHWWLAHAEMLLRDIDRVGDAHRRANECPLGAGAVAGGVVRLDREAIARRLGFDRPCANSMDATSDRDFAIELVQACALLAVHLSRLSEDLILYSTQEFGFVRLADAFSTGSSAMPQKKNPDALELVRAHAGVMAGNATALLACAKALPLSYNKDLQETQRPLFDTVDRTLSALAVLTGVVATLEFDTGRAGAAARSGGMNALAVAACIAGHGVPFRRAHEMVAGAIRLAVARDCELEHLSDDDWGQCGVDVSPSELRASMTTSAVLELHDVEGGTAPARVAGAIRAIRERLHATKGAVGAHS